MKYIIISVVILSICFYFWNSLTKNSNGYNSIIIGESIVSLTDKMGVPNSISINYKDSRMQNWEYSTFLVPKVYTIIILDNKIIDKYEAISP